MGIKKIARPMNKAKNSFVKWLKDNKADNIEGHDDIISDDEWDYYCAVSGFIDDELYISYFMVWRSEEKIDYSDEENSYKDMTIDNFKCLLNLNS